MWIRAGAWIVFAVLLLVARASKPSETFQKEFLLSFEDAETKVLKLAKAIPAEKYSWRPGKDVRSVGEVYVHIANGNRLLLTLAGGMPPDEAFEQMVKAGQDREKSITDKADVLEDLEASFKQVHGALKAAAEADLSKPIEFFGTPSTPRAVFMALSNHVSEHLGQSIAYARMNGVVPPWSRGQ
jgi:uncharacterized damage-inducible protein DinB